MRIRRPLAALLTALALFGGSATLTACGDPAGVDRSDGTTDDTGEGNDSNQENEEGGGDLPDNSDAEPGQGDGDQQDPD